MGSTAQLLSDHLETRTPKSPYETVPLFKPETSIQIPFKVKQSFVDLLYAEIPTPDDSGPIRPEKKPWSLYGLLEDLNTASYSVHHFRLMYQRLCDWNTRYFEEICEQNQITTGAERDAVKLFFEMMKLQMMQHFLSVLTGKDEHTPKKSEEKTDSNLIKAAKGLAFGALATGTLVSEGSDGFLAGMVIAGAMGFQGIAALPVAILTGGFNAYMHYAIDIRSSQEEVGVATEEYIRPMTEIHRAQMVTAQNINDILREEGHKYDDLAQMIDCANIATQFNDSLFLKNQGITEYEESTDIKIRRTVLGLIGGGIVGTFSYLTLTLAFFGLSALFGPLGLIAFAATFAVLAGLCYFVSAMPLGLFSLFNPDAKEVKETREMVVEYDERNKNLTQNLNEKILKKMKTQENKLRNDISDLETTIYKLLWAKEPVNQLILEEQSRKIQNFTTQLNKLLLSCKNLSPAILSKEEMEKLKKKITSEIKLVSNLHKKLADQNKSLIKAAAEKAEKEKKLAKEELETVKSQLQEAKQTIQDLKTQVDTKTRITQDLLQTKIEELVEQDVSYLNKTAAAEIEKLHSEVAELTAKNAELESKQNATVSPLREESDTKLRISTKRMLSPSCSPITTRFFSPPPLESPVFARREPHLVLSVG